MRDNGIFGAVTLLVVFFVFVGILIFVSNYGHDLGAAEQYCVDWGGVAIEIDTGTDLKDDDWSVICQSGDEIIAVGQKYDGGA